MPEAAADVNITLPASPAPEAGQVSQRQSGYHVPRESTFQRLHQLAIQQNA